MHNCIVAADPPQANRTSSEAQLGRGTKGRLRAQVLILANSICRYALKKEAFRKSWFKTPKSNTRCVACVCAYLYVCLFVGVNVRVYLSLCARACVCVCRSVCESPVGSTSCAKPGRAGNSSVLLPRPLIYPLIVIFGRDTFRTYLQMCMNEEAVCSFFGLCGRFGVWGGLFGSAVKILKESTDSRVFCASRSQPDCSLAWTS